MLTDFYDIESLSNVFTCTSYIPHTNEIHVYYIDDDGLMGKTTTEIERNKALIVQRILDNNPRLTINGSKPPTTMFFDLWDRYGRVMFASEFLFRSSNPDDNANIHLGAVSNDGTKSVTHIAAPFKPNPHTFYDTNVILDTDQAFKNNPDEYPYLLGYNSYNYDTTMLAYTFSRLFQKKAAEKTVSFDNPFTEKTETRQEIGYSINAPEDPADYVRAAEIRRFNDLLFNENYKKFMYQALNVLSINPADNVAIRRYLQEGRRLAAKDVINAKRIYDAANAYPANIRLGMLNTGRHIDVARLNEKQAHVGLKRLLGMLGYQIFESSKLKPGQSTLVNVDEFADLISYNVSDVVYLEALFNSGAYASAFERNKTMLDTYPELVYETAGTNPDGSDIITDTPLARRLFIDSSSQQLASRALSPHGPLDDKPTVSYMYPDKSKLPEGVDEPFDVLEYAKDFFYSDVLSLIPEKDGKRAAAKAKFDHVYQQYNTIRGKNFNASARHNSLYKARAYNEKRDSSVESATEVHTLAGMKLGLPYCIPYYDGDGNETSCFAVFSTGGVHGAEYNKQLFDADMAAFEKVKANFDFLMNAFGNDDEGALALRLSVKRLADPICVTDENGDEIEFPDGQKHYVKEFLKTGSTKKHSSWKQLKAPQLFETDPITGSNKLHPKYTFTSAARVNHEDFSSYYPSLLRMMNVFYNETVKDRYGEIYERKESLGKLMKKPGISQAQRDRYFLDRNGVKLILNTASGAGDATFDNNVRMNNNILAMRVIGQLFTWKIGQAQSLHSAKVVSTNTDGLYTLLDEEENNRLLAEEAKQIHIQIDPEPMYLISKDSNNRIEFEIVEAAEGEESPIVRIDPEDPTKTERLKTADGAPAKLKVLSASGGKLACRRGPDVQKSLAHPAVLDWALAEYLMRTFARSNFDQAALSEPFDMNLGRQILIEATQEGDRIHGLTMFQNVIASNPNSYTYIFSEPDELNITNQELFDLNRAEHPTDPVNNDSPGCYDENNIGVLQHYNRVYIMRDKTPETVHLNVANARKPNPAAIKRAKTNANANPDGKPRYDVLSPTAEYVLKMQGENIDALVHEREIVRKKVTDIEPEWFMLIENSDLHCMPKERIEWIYENLDIEKYLMLLAKVFEDTWRNHLR